MTFGDAFVGYLIQVVIGSMGLFYVARLIANLFR